MSPRVGLERINQAKVCLVVVMANQLHDFHSLCYTFAKRELFGKEADATDTLPTISVFLLRI